jgi:hypothetical protein
MLILCVSPVPVIIWWQLASGLSQLIVRNVADCWCLSILRRKQNALGVSQEISRSPWSWGTQPATRCLKSVDHGQGHRTVILSVNKTDVNLAPLTLWTKIFNFTKFRTSIAFCVLVSTCCVVVLLVSAPTDTHTVECLDDSEQLIEGDVQGTGSGQL